MGVAGVDVPEKSIESLSLRVCFGGGFAETIFAEARGLVSRLFEEFREGSVVVGKHPIAIAPDSAVSGV